MFYRPGLARVFVVNAILRAQWARKFLLPNLIDIPLNEILEARKRRRTSAVDAKTEARSPPEEFNAADQSRQTGPWRMILIGGLIAGVLLLMIMSTTFTATR
jgi:hypothetical protein